METSKPFVTHRRFDRAARLLGDAGLAKLAQATVTVVGVGGVGSFAAEALVRSGVGRVILIDFDRICVTNVNRQLHAMKGTLGKRKVDIMAERLRLINPDADIEARAEFYGAESAARLLTPEPDFVIDAIDNLTAKMHLLMTCRQRQLRVISCLGAAARLDPTQVRVADLAHTRHDPFARALRKHLRKNWGLDSKKPTGILTVYSEELPTEPQPLAYDEGEFECVCPGGKNGLNDCDHRNRIEGSLAFVPSVFGLTAASVVVRTLTGVSVPKLASDGGAAARFDNALPEAPASDTHTAHGCCSA